eukprot:1945976-Lingulodinium_polyedra.AAC.1
MEEVLPPAIQGWLRDIDQHLLKDEQQWGAAMEAGVIEHGYMDPRLKHSGATYSQFISDLEAAGLVDFVQPDAVAGRVTAFCVRKKSGAQRLVIDCRPINARFLECPHVPMGSGSTWAEVVMSDDAQMWLTASDIRDFFYACGVPAELA